MATTTVFQSTKVFMVKNLRPGLTECGKIKIGQKGKVIVSRKGNEFQPPEKLDHFVVTTLERGADGNFLTDTAMHAKFGREPKELPVRLLFNDPWLNFQTTYAAMRGGSRFCTGDGERAQRVDNDGVVHEVDCPCPLLADTYTGNDKCKINGTLSVMIDGAEVVGGVWKLRTTSINTCQGIASSLALLSSVTSGNIAGIPLMLTIRPKAAVTPQGATTTIYVVGIEFRGTIEALRKLAHERALGDATFGQRMERIEEQARAMLSAPVPISDDETMDIADEFYPAEGARARGVPLAERKEPEQTGAGQPRMRTLTDFVTTHGKPAGGTATAGEVGGKDAGEAAGAATEPQDARQAADAPTHGQSDDRPATGTAGAQAQGSGDEPAAQGEPTVELVLPGRIGSTVLPVGQATADLIDKARSVKGERGARWIRAAILANAWVDQDAETKAVLEREAEACLTGN